MSLNAEDVRRIAREEAHKVYEEMLKYQLHGLQPAVSKPANETAVAVTPEQIKQAFPEDLRQHLTVTTKTIKTEFVSREKWNQMNEIAKGLGFKYVSEPKNSRWER